MGLGDDEPGRERLLAHRSVGETLLVAVIFAVAMGFTWVNQGGDDSVDLAAPPTQRTATGGDGAPGRIPPSQPAIPVSFTSSGEVIRPTALRARIIDPETGEDVVVPLPPGTTVVDGEVVPVGTTVTTRSGGTATTGPGTGTTGTTSAGTPTTGPPTTQPPTTQPPTTQPPTTQPTTTQPPTTQPPTTQPTTTQPPYPQGQGAVGGLLGAVAGLLN
jgi:hypothetical protein